MAMTQKQRDFNNLYKKNNKEKIAKDQAEYWHKNKERLMEYKKKWRDKNKEKINEKRNILRVKNTEKIKKQERIRYYKKRCDNNDYINVSESLYQLKKELK